MPENVPTVLELFSILDRGGRFFVTSQVTGGLTWSDYFALGERAALLTCKPRPLGLDEIDEAGILTFNVNTNGCHSFIFPSM